MGLVAVVTKSSRVCTYCFGITRPDDSRQTSPEGRVHKNTLYDITNARVFSIYLLFKRELSDIRKNSDN